MAATMIRSRQGDDDAFLTSGSMAIPSAPDFYKPLSLRLCKILDSIGASEDTRMFYMETAITVEIINSCVFKNKNKSTNMFGSKAEGTTTFGLKSDTDVLYCDESCEVLQCISDIPMQHDGECRLIVREENTKPGYCKLQKVELKTPITRSHVFKQLPVDFKFDFNDKVVKTSVNLSLNSTLKPTCTAHGPAMSTPASYISRAIDIVGAYRCRSWPNAASEWLERKRKYGWPSEDLIEKLKTLGFFVVKVGHPHSCERDLEWRISLSLQERLLMFSLNPTQFKCYILLKMVKKDNINKKLGVEAISSYHCKTCLFYMIENTPGDFWQPSNLLSCLQCCLKCMYKWVKSGNCPNYFIPKENMFEGRLDDELRINLEKICHVLLTADCGFLLSIQCDGVAKRVVNSIYPVTATLESGILAEQRLGHYIDCICVGLDSSYLVLYHFRNNTTEAIREMFRCIYEMSHAIPVTEHTGDQMRTAAYIALPYLELSLISVIIANNLELGKAETAVDLLLSSKWQELSNRSDSFSAKLKQATFLYMVGQYEACQEVLKPLVANSSPLQISDCICKGAMIFLPKGLLTPESKVISFDEFRTSYYAPCIRFSWFEKKLIPIALAYEMLNSVHTPPAQWGDYGTFVNLDSAMVDSKILLWFLIFLLSKATGTQATGLATEKMELILNTDINLRHKETAMNLIGWCYKQEGNIGKALEYFSLSLTRMKRHNAAFWHVLFTVCEMMSDKT